MKNHISDLCRYQAQDFNGQILAEVSALKTPRPAFAPLFTNQFVHQNWTNKVCSKIYISALKKPLFLCTIYYYDLFLL